MPNDPILKILSLIMIIAGGILALRPDWFIYVGSYGKGAKVNPNRLLVVRIIAGITVLILLFDLAWPLPPK